MAASMKLCRFFRNFTTLSKNNRYIHITRLSAGAYDQDFKEAQGKLKTFETEPDNQTKLQIYALFKQATEGKPVKKRPGMMDFVGRAKWDAWNAISNITQDEAQKKYIDLISELQAANGPSQNTTQVESVPTSASSPPTTLQLESRDGMSIIKLNRPNKKNAINLEMYHEIGDALQSAGEDKNTRITVVTGAGDYYCSGNDLSNFMGVDPSGMEQMARDGAVTLERFVSCFIEHPKPLVALVNGPAIGVAVTTLGLFDVVYASDRASFHTPFSSLGQSPEGCSTVTFPRLMGTGKACEVMLFGKKLSAKEAEECNLVTEVFPHAEFQAQVWEKVTQYAKLPKNSMRLSKQLIRNVEKETLHRANKAECELLIERWQSDECVQAIMEFFSKKAKL